MNLLSEMEQAKENTSSKLSKFAFEMTVSGRMPSIIKSQNENSQ